MMDDTEHRDEEDIPLSPTEREIQLLAQKNIPAMLNELNQTTNALHEIADWCTKSYLLPSQQPREATVQHTKTYLQDAMITVAKHVCNLAAGIQRKIDLQAAEVEAAAAEVRLMENRIAYQKASLAHSALDTLMQRRDFAPVVLGSRKPAVPNIVHEVMPRRKVSCTFPLASIVAITHRHFTLFTGWRPRYQCPRYFWHPAAGGGRGGVRFLGEWRS